MLRLGVEQRGSVFSIPLRRHNKSRRSRVAGLLWGFICAYLGVVIDKWIDGWIDR